MDEVHESTVGTETAPVLYSRASVARISTHVAELVANGDLTPTHQRRLQAAVAQLGQAEDLLYDAQRVLDGDEHAVERLRTVLLAHRATRPASRATTGSPEQPSAVQPASRGLALLAAAAIWAADDPQDAQSLLDGVSALLWPRGLIELLATLHQPTPPAPMRMLMGSAPAPLDFDGQLEPSPPQRPAVPRLGRDLPSLDRPLWPLFPSKVGKPVFDQNVPGGLRLEVPVYVEPCILRAIAAVSHARDAAPQWHVESFSNPSACPGQFVLLTGSGFGSTKGTVYFTGTQAEWVEATDVQWSDTGIQVRVPADAAPGPIRLQILVGTLSLCGGQYPVFRRGSSAADFSGGTPRIYQFVLDPVAYSNPVVSPDSDVTLFLSTSVGPSVTGHVTIRRGATLIAQFAGLAGGNHDLVFHAPPAATPVVLTATAEVQNGCATVISTFTITVAEIPHPHIRGVELVQAVQAPDPLLGGSTNSVRLVERKRTALRVYVESGLSNGFSWGKTPGELPLTGTAHIAGASGVQYGIVPIKVHSATQTANRGSALEFELPWQLLRGSVTVSVSIWPDPPPLGTTAFAVATASVTGLFEHRRNQVIYRLAVRDDLRPALPIPTVADWRASLRGAIDRFPVAETGFIEAVTPGWEVMGTDDNDLGTEEGWQDMLDDFDDLADDFYNPNNETIWAAVTPNPPSGVWATNVAGIAHAYASGGWFASDEVRVMLDRKGLLASFAHELGHTVGLHHSGGYEHIGIKGVDTSLPPSTETGAVLWRASDDHTIVAPSPELMAYSKTPEERMPSIETWKRLFNYFA